MRRVLLSGLAALMAALLVPSPTSAAGPTCRGSLSGAVQGKFACVIRITRDGETTFFTIVPKDNLKDVPTYAPGSFEIPGTPRPTTYTLDTLAKGLASVAAEGGALYTAAKTSSQRGEVTLRLTSVRADPSSDGGVVVRGTYRAKLIPAGAGKTGEVVVEVTF